LAFDPELAFRFMQMNYRHGLTDRMAGIAGEALGQVLAERNLCMEDLIIMMDGASDETLDRMERILSRSTLLLRLAANERMTAFQVKLLGMPGVRRRAVAGMARALGGVVDRSLEKRPSAEALRREARSRTEVAP